MNVAVFSFEQNSIINITPQVILTSHLTRRDLQLADAGLQLDELIHFGNQQIDVVCVINKDVIDQTILKTFPADDYIDRVYYTSKDIHTSSFYCKPSVFSLISNLYKIDFSSYGFKNTDNDSVELLSEKIFYIINRIGIEVSFE